MLSAMTDGVLLGGLGNGVTMKKLMMVLALASSSVLADVGAGDLIDSAQGEVMSNISAVGTALAVVLSAAFVLKALPWIGRKLGVLFSRLHD